MSVELSLRRQPTSRGGKPRDGGAEVEAEEGAHKKEGDSRNTEIEQKSALLEYKRQRRRQQQKERITDASRTVVVSGLTDGESTYSNPITDTCTSLVISRARKAAMSA